MNKQNTFIPFVVLLVATIMTIASFFLPYTSVTPERRELIEQFPDGIFVEEIGMTNKDIADMSLVEYFKVYSYMANNNQSVSDSVICITMICVTALFTLLIALFVCLRRAVPIIVFSILDFGIFCLLGKSFEILGVGGKYGSYEFSVAYYLFIIALIIIFAAAIWLLIVKMKNKRAVKLEATNDSKE